MRESKIWTELNWGWISGMALGLGSTVGVALHSWSMFFAVTIVVAAFMILQARRVR